MLVWLKEVDETKNAEIVADIQSHTGALGDGVRQAYFKKQILTHIRKRFKLDGPINV